MQGKSTSLINRLREENQFSDVNEIIDEERNCRYFKEMYVKHAFDNMGNLFKDIYNMQAKHLATLKENYKRNYGT